MAETPQSSAPGGSQASGPKRPIWRRWWFLSSGVIVLLIIIAAVSGGTKHPKKPHESSTSKTTPKRAFSSASTKASASPTTTTPPATTSPPTTAAPTTTTTTSAPVQAAPFHFSGSGQQATPPFTVSSGLAILTATYSGSANFSVSVDKSSGSLVDIPINFIGSYSGSVFEGLTAGSYVLSVTGTTGTWSITVTQPRKLPASSLPQTYSGHGQKVVGPFGGSGALRLQATYNGSANFSVQIRSARDGSLQDIPINVIGSYNGSTISNETERGPYYAEVGGTTGTWSLTVSPG